MTILDLRTGKPCEPPAPPKPLPWIEPAIAPNIVTSLAPKIDTHGPLSIVYWAFAERSIDCSERTLQAIVCARLTMPTALLREAGEALIAAADAAEAEPSANLPEVTKSIGEA